MIPVTRVAPDAAIPRSSAELYISPERLSALLQNPAEINSFAGADISCVAVDISALFRDAPAGASHISPRVAAEAAVSNAVTLAEVLGVPNVALCGDITTPIDETRLTRLIDRVLNEASRRGVTLLIETRGLFADSARLIDILDTYADDNLAAYWFAGETYKSGESADATIGRLGAYVRAVNSEGAMPQDDLYRALRSIDYKGTVLGALPSPDSPAPPPDLSDPSLVDLTFPELLDEICARFPNQPAFDFSRAPGVLECYPDGCTPGFPDGYTRTYAELRRDVDELARALIELGVRPGTKVAVWMTNIPQWYIVFWAVVKIGAVLVTVNTAYKIREAEYLLRQADVHTLFMIDGYKDSRYNEIIAELCPELQHTPTHEPLRSTRLPFLRHIVNVSAPQTGCLTWEDMKIRAARVPESAVSERAAAVRPDDVCNMQYTSGTTGFPKGVMLTHRNIVNNGKCIGDRMALTERDKMMIHVPMFHCFGMVLAMTAAMTHAVTMSPLPYFSPRAALRCIRDREITCFHGVPTMFIAMLEHPDFDPRDFKHMRTGIMAGSPCPIPVMRDVVEKMNMSQITIVFGQTESSPGCTQSSTDDSVELRVSTVGSAFPGVECKIVDAETGVDLPDEADGEFVARGYNIMKGYYKMPNAAAAAIDRDGWLHTGDVARRTPEGYYKITGRLKDMIIRGGENIYPKEIEEFIYTHPKVRDVQVIGVPSEQYGEEIMAVVIPREGEALTSEDIRDYVRRNMAKHKVPSYVSFTAEFPMNAAGKILKYKMREDAVKELGLERAAGIETA
ncbi:MAG: AMP-binding protein [Oscillospiraceae bacterium]|jgi:fatty-acyl-CoA synthase|nr:AMP-binding protein [Oscillospiraceae bacterium]